MSDVLVEHDPIEYFTLGELPTWNLLNLCIPLDVNLHPAIRHLDANGLDSLDCEVGDEIPPAANKFGVNGTTDNLPHCLMIVRIHLGRKRLHYFKRIIQSLHVPRDNECWVKLFFDEWLSHAEHLTSQDNDRSCSVTHFFILGTAQLNHVLSSRVRDIHFSKNRIAIVGHNNASHWVQQHLQHRTWAKCGSDNASYGLPRLYVG
mmetsp:Transcript_127147/g.220431  ORF Transcript_127147/g.220431 Transcript_127147/m.220431 type:complete len:204 (-) Transcript_127147:171-782(-)